MRPAIKAGLRTSIETAKAYMRWLLERHVEGVSVAVSKSAEATKLSARSLAWLEALAPSVTRCARRREFKSPLSAQTKCMHLWCELD